MPGTGAVLEVDVLFDVVCVFTVVFLRQMDSKADFFAYDLLLLSHVVSFIRVNLRTQSLYH